MLLNVAAALDLPAVDERWARWQSDEHTSWLNDERD
jgi:hypothetical protein